MSEFHIDKWKGHEPWELCDDCGVRRPREQLVASQRKCLECKQSVKDVFVCADKQQCETLWQALHD